MKKKYPAIKTIIKILLIFSILTLSVFNLETAQTKNAISYNKEGWDYINKGDYFRSILSFKNALKQNPKYKEALLGLGKAYIKTEAYDESLRLLGDVLKIDKNNLEAVNALGFVMTELGKYTDALKYFEMTLKSADGNIEANYGIAYIYYLMDRMIWAKRKLANIFLVNPYHYESLLLMADIKIKEKRDDEAKAYIQKAIDANNDVPDGYIKYGQMLLRDYKETLDNDYLADAAEKFSRALAIHPENLSANRSMGNLFLLQKNYEQALRYFQRTIKDYPDNSISFYNMAITYANTNDSANAINYFLKAIKAAPSDSIARSRLEDFLVLNEFAEGHPLRVKFSEEHHKKAADKLKINLPLDAMMHYQRSLLLNPLARTARENMRDVYQTLNYHELYINEQKTLFSLYPENKYQDMLKIAIIKRRDRVYHRAGYSTELPPRDVPKILVLNFSSVEPVSLHPDTGEVIANYLTFVIGQFGRMQPIGIQKRLEISKKLKDDRKSLGDNLEKIGDMVKQEEIEKPDFIISGTFREGVNFLTIDYELLDFSTGVIINNFYLSETGKENLPNIAIRSIKKLYDAIPYKGRVLQVNDNEIIVNMGLIDGIKPGDFIIINKIDGARDRDVLKIKKKLVLQIEESDTMISNAKPKLAKDIEFIDINDIVYPFQKRRAKLIK